MVELYEPSAPQCKSSVIDTLELLEACGSQAYHIENKGGLRRIDADGQKALLEAGLHPSIVFKWNEIL
jgi:hypothetical protein